MIPMRDQDVAVVKVLIQDQSEVVTDPDRAVGQVDEEAHGEVVTRGGGLDQATARNVIPRVATKRRSILESVIQRALRVKPRATSKKV